MNIAKWLVKNTQSLSGKTVVITGATGGLGEELCLYLAQLGARLILICRSEDKFNKLKSRVREYHPETQMEFIFADLEDIDTVKSAETLLEDRSIDVLILNAGAYSIPRKMSSTGFDNVFQINFISQYYLARRLLPALRRNGGRVVAVSSIAHNYSKSSKDDIDFSGKKASSLVYGNAKRYLTYALQELFKEEKETGLAVVHPGIAFTNITAHYPRLIFALIKQPMKVIFMKPRVACLSVLLGVFKNTPQNYWIGPWLFDIWGRPDLKPLKTAKEEERMAIFRRAEEIYEGQKDAVSVLSV